MIWKRGYNREIEECELEEVLLFLEKSSEIECDTETTGLDPHINDILCIQFGDKNNQYLIEWEEKLVNILKPIFNSDRVFIFHNAKFDLQFLYKYNIIVKNVYDTFIAESILTCGTLSPRNLKFIAQKYLNIDISKTVREEFVNRKNIILKDNLHLVDYGLDDVKYLSLIKEKQLEKIIEYNLEKSLSLDNKFVVVLAYIEFTGMNFDPDKWLENVKENELLEKNLLLKMNEQVVHLKLKKFYNYAGLFCDNPIVVDGVSYETTITWTSPKQVVSLFKDLGINVSVEEDGELKESVGKQILQQNSKEHILVKLYSDYIQNRKLLSSFGKKYLDFIHPITKRIHTSYKQILNTGRMSSGNKKDNKPNLQQLPADPRYRKCFIPSKGNVLIASDYKGMESVVFANKTLDEGLLDFYDNGLSDMHSFIASMCFKKDLEGVDMDEIKSKRPDLRQKAKGAGFAIQFGGVGYTIANNLGISDEEGEEVYSSYMEAFKGVKNYFDEVIKETFDNGYITFNDITNRKSFFDFIDKFKELQEKMDKMDWREYREHKSSNSSTYQNIYKPLVKEYFNLKGRMERRALNYPIQGSSADITKTALLLIWNYIISNNLLDTVKIVNVVHDEILVECPENIKDNISEVVLNSMRKAGDLFFKRVRLDASSDIGDHWIH